MCIVVPDKLSEDQYQIELFNYCTEGIQVMRPKHLLSSHPSQVYICDEGDLLLDKHAVLIHKSTPSYAYKIRGLAAVFHGEKSYFMSATLDPLQLRLLK